MSALAALHTTTCAPEIRGRWTPAQREMIHATLTAPMPRGRGILRNRRLPQHLAESRVAGREHIILVSYYPSASLAKKSAVLRQNGNHYVTLLACCIRDDFETDRFFDQAYEVQDYQELWALLTVSQPACVHAFIHPWVIGALAVAAKAHTGTRTVIDVNDSQLFLRRSPEHPECDMEKTILEQADAFTHKMPAAAIAELRAQWDLHIPDTLIHSLPLPELFVDGPQPPASVDHPSLVFAGGVMPYELARTRGHEGHIFDPMIQTICASGCRLTMYVNQNAREMFWLEHQHYHDFALAFPNFSFQEGVPFFALPAHLATHHFGLYYENSAASSYSPKHFQYNMATKIFSYLEAGLPLLVPESAIYIRDLVVEHGLGLIYRLEEWGALMNRLKTISYPQLVANVRTFRQTHSTDSTLPLLEQTYTIPQNPPNLGEY